MSVGNYVGYGAIFYNPEPVSYPFFDLGAWALKPPAPVHRVDKLHKLCDADGVVFASPDKASLGRYIDERNKLLLATKDQIAKLNKRRDEEATRIKSDESFLLKALDERASQGRI